MATKFYEIQSKYPFGKMNVIVDTENAFQPTTTGEIVDVDYTYTINGPTTLDITGYKTYFVGGSVNYTATLNLEAGSGLVPGERVVVKWKAMTYYGGYNSQKLELGTGIFGDVVGSNELNPNRGPGEVYNFQAVAEFVYDGEQFVQVSNFNIPF